MQIKETMISLPRAVWIALSLVAATEIDEIDEEDSEPKTYEFEYTPTKEVVSILKRSRAINEDLCEELEELSETLDAQEAVAKKKRVDFNIAPWQGEVVRLKDLLEDLEKDLKIQEIRYSKREMIDDEKAVEAVKQQWRKWNPNLSEEMLLIYIEITDEVKLMRKNEKENNRTDSERSIIETNNNLKKAVDDIKDKILAVKENLNSINTKYEYKLETAGDNMSEWLEKVNSTPFDIVEKDNSGQYLLDYETMCFFVKFLSADPEFTRLFKENHYNSEEQPFLWIFEWILLFDSVSHDLLKEKITMHSESFGSYSDMMKFVIEKIFKEDSRFVDVLNNKVELISRLENQNEYECHAIGVEPPEPTKRNESIATESTDVMNPQISSQSSFESKGHADQKESEPFNKQRMVLLHELIRGYKDSKLRIQARRLEFSEEESNDYSLQFESIRTGMPDNEAVKRKIRAIAFKCKNNEGKVMLNFITTEALNTYLKKEKDSVLEKLISCAVFILYEDNETVGYGYICEA
ncbi:hypothetical protein ENBRE01_1268 [Enteropsectra breve]|nr:hypothetical protein ENBRE01_1268 [Enteropsectra breve]